MRNLRAASAFRSGLHFEFKVYGAFAILPDEVDERFHFSLRLLDPVRNPTDQPRKAITQPNARNTSR